MTYFIRKIEFPKWQQSNLAEGEPVSADATTICLKTQDNALSVWKLSEESDIPHGIIAIASAYNNLKTSYFAILSADELAEKNLATENTPHSGITNYPSFKENHFDIISLNYVSLGSVIDVIKDNILDENIICITQSNLAWLCALMVKVGNIDFESLHDSVKKETNKKLSYIDEGKEIPVINIRYVSLTSTGPDRAWNITATIKDNVLEYQIIEKQGQEAA